MENPSKRWKGRRCYRVAAAFGKRKTLGPMTLPRIALLALAALFFLAGCDREAMLQKFASEEDRKFATQCIDTLRAGKLDEIEQQLDASLRTAETHAVLVRIIELLPKEEPSAVKLVGAQLQVGTQGRDSNLTYQYSYGERHFLINCAIRTKDSGRVIFGLNVHGLDASIEQQQEFGLAGKTPLQYAVLLGVVVALVLTLVALIRCVMEKELRRKWLWVLFIIVGIGQFSVNWHDGNWVFSPVYLMLFSASAVSYGYGGFELSVALPLGAIVYLVRRSRNHRAASRSNDA